jgi:hypothetical protein
MEFAIVSRVIISLNKNHYNVKNVAKKYKIAKFVILNLLAKNVKVNIF